jgi:hypothetical protein
MTVQVTICVRSPVLEEKCLSPRWAAVIVWAPDVTDDVFRVAEIVPLAGPSVPVPSGAQLSEKSATPLRMPARGHSHSVGEGQGLTEGDRLLDDERAVVGQGLVDGEVTRRGGGGEVGIAWEPPPPSRHLRLTDPRNA